MAHNDTARVSLGQLKTSLLRVKSEYEEEIEDAAASIGEVAADEEVAEMLDEIFG